MTSLHDALADQGVRPPRGQGWREGNWKTLCPRCSDTRKKKDDPCLSVTVTQDRGDLRAVWNCHHCGWTDWAGSGRLDRVRRAERQWRRPALKPVPPQPAVLQWLGSRGIPEWVVRQERIYAAKVWMPQSQETEAVVAFPFYEDDPRDPSAEPVNAKYREPKRKWFRQEKDAKPVPYRRWAIRGEKVITIVEGEPDALSMVAVGVGATISVPDGAPKPKIQSDGQVKPLDDDSAKFMWLELIWEDIEAAEKVVLAADADEPGRLLQSELIRRIGREKCWVVDWPPGCNDANAVLLAHGEEVLRQCWDAARPIPAAGEITVTDVWDDVEAQHSASTVEWFSTGWREVDEFYRVLLGQVTVVTGYAHDGKSTFLSQMQVQMALDHGWRWAIFSPETDPVQHVITLLEQAARAPFYDGPTQRLPIEVVRSYKAWLTEHFHFIRWERPKGGRGRPTSEWFFDRLDYMVRRYGIRGWSLDPYNRIQPGQGYARETDFVIDLMDEAQAFAKRSRTHGWLVAHPAKQLRDRTGKRPAKLGLGDISGSANWENATDMGLLVRRIWEDGSGNAIPPGKTPVELECLKARNRHSGQKGGKLMFSFRKADGTLHPMVTGDGAWVGPDEPPGP